jgi:hypothetical protein
MKKTRHNYEIYLDEIGIPEHDKKSNGGRISDSANYGAWLRRNDPIAFEVGYREWEN